MKISRRILCNLNYNKSLKSKRLSTAHKHRKVCSKSHKSYTHKINTRKLLILLTIFCRVTTEWE